MGPDKNGGLSASDISIGCNLEHSSNRRNYGIYQTLDAVGYKRTTDRPIPVSPEDYGPIEVNKGALPETVTVWEYGHQGLRSM